MTHLGVDSLMGDSHEDHDSFVKTYLTTELTEGEDCIVKALAYKQLELVHDKPKLVTKTTEIFDPYSVVDGKEVNSLSASVPEAQRIHHLAQYILLTQYPEKWEDMFDAAFGLLAGILREIQEGFAETIYPPRWTQQIFRLENCLGPNELHGIIFGIDPTNAGDQCKYATGYAFTFNYPDRKEFDPDSIFGLREAYCLKNADAYKSVNGSHCLEKDLVEPHGIGMVNFIRIIQGWPGAGYWNNFKDPWIKYNKAWLEYMHKSRWGDLPIGGISAGSSNATNSGEPRIGKDRVLIFQNEDHKFDQYSTSKEFMDTVALLTDASRCSHPSRILANVGHCILAPNTYYETPGNKTDRCNVSVTAFKTFLEERGAHGALCCRHCLNKSDESGNETDDLDHSDQGASSSTPNAERPQTPPASNTTHTATSMSNQKASASNGASTKTSAASESASKGSTKKTSPSNAASPTSSDEDESDASSAGRSRTSSASNKKLPATPASDSKVPALSGTSTKTSTSTGSATKGSTSTGSATKGST